MTHRVLPLAAFLALAVAAAAQQAGGKAKSKSGAEVEAVDAPKGDSAAKKRVEAWLAKRVKRIQDMHAARVDFSIKEEQAWEDFWEKVREERKTFELRTARQTLDLFSTLEVLQAKDHGTSIADFEKLRANMFKSFEAQQKEKMTAYFAAREARWKEFAATQERERLAFAADADANWQDDKLFLKSAFAPSAAPLPGSSKK